MSTQLRVPHADIAALAAIARERAATLSGPCVIALDGRSGAGKSTLAEQLAKELDACLVDGDAFFAGGVDVRRDSPEERAHACIDWRRQRPVLEALRAGREASYHGFDWDAFDGTLEAEPTILKPAAFVILEGVYAARPELEDLVDLRVMLTVSDVTRQARLVAREGSIGAWERQWHEAEDWYFGSAAPLSGFDVVVRNDDPG
ncbi:MAG: AAA family ATPase [Polyangiaceae bacterium]|nr:AAA family ATPase [Polyangiaceae bacterium]